jgi:predicted RNase H-like nuclease (RuvC/YqgF family)
MKHAPFYAILATLALFAWGCRDKEMEQQVSTLKGQNQELTNNITSQEAYIDEVVASINKIYEEVEQTRSTEKSLLSEAKGFEGGAKLTKAEVRSQLTGRIESIRGTLRDNSEKLTALQKKLNQNRKQYASLQAMVDNLKKTVEEREQSIAALQVRVASLEGEVAEKSTMVAARDSVIGVRQKQISTVYYIVGTKRELEKKGIIRDEGGFLSIGETTVLASGLDKSLFTPVDRDNDRIFHVDGKIDEILPKRNPDFYTQEKVGGKESLLTVADADHFWQDKYLVILVD